MALRLRSSRLTLRGPTQMWPYRPVPIAESDESEFLFRFIVNGGVKDANDVMLGLHQLATLIYADGELTLPALLDSLVFHWEAISSSEIFRPRHPWVRLWRRALRYGLDVRAWELERSGRSAVQHARILRTLS